MSGWNDFFSDLAMDDSSVRVCATTAGPAGSECHVALDINVELQSLVVETFDCQLRAAARKACYSMLLSVLVHVSDARLFCLFIA